MSRLHVYSGCAVYLEQSLFLCIVLPPSFPPYQGGMTGGCRYTISENALSDINTMVPIYSIADLQSEVAGQALVLGSVAGSGPVTACTYSMRNSWDTALSMRFSSSWRFPSVLACKTSSRST